MIPKKAVECFLRLTDTQLLALCIYGETGKKAAMGELLGVAWCVMNQSRDLERLRLGETPEHVRPVPGQFHCFREGNPNRLGLMAIAGGWDRAFQRNKHLRECFRIAEGVMSGDLPDNVSGAIHYRKSTDQAPRSEATQLVAVIGNYEFFA